MIMKKTYQKPSVNVTIVQFTQMLADSLTKNATGADAGVVLTKGDNSWDVWGDDDFRDE